MKTTSKQVLLVVLALLAVTVAVTAKPVVVPTYYGYGTVSQRSGLVYPYIAGHSAPFYPPSYVVTDLPYRED